MNINVASTSNIIKTLPGFRGDLLFKLETGYVGVGAMDDVQLFYYFFESEGSPEYDPLVLWLNGGSDHPGLMLVPIKLNGTNYPFWSKSMLHALTAKNKVGFVNGSVQPPSETEQPTEYALWNQCNSMILSWLAHSVEPDLAKAVVHAKTIHQVWQHFKDQFSQKNAPTIYQIQKSIASLSQSTMTVSDYYKKLKDLWDELETYQTLLTCNEMKAHNT
ncbi:hypothetical protein L3X38_043924 [Prunus dulcis]|uniref:Retrotransposon Copia-like N-terminal domain-containing protein n=1 Tax=Prunus dulcis TaxID=3755 RepID=A0AAD4UY09_PRUDU|nr:hypothetical protein L3X38_043924 [Prunus dulcis]